MFKGNCYYGMETRILIAPNCFKECASANKIATIINSSLRKEKYFNNRCFPVSDRWNKVEIWVKGNSAVFYMNNKLSAKLWNIRYIPPDDPQHY